MIGEVIPTLSFAARSGGFTLSGYGLEASCWDRVCAVARARSDYPAVRVEVDPTVMKLEMEVPDAQLICVEEALRTALGGVHKDYPEIRLFCCRLASVWG